MDPVEPLVLRYEGLGDRLEALFRDLQADPSMQDAFVSNPASFLEGFGEAPTAGTQSDINRLIFSVLRNDEFRSWADDFSRRHLEDVEPSEEPGGAITIKGDSELLFREVAEALVRYGDQDALVRLAGADPAEIQPLGDADPALRLPPLPKPVNVNININFSVTATVVLVALAIAIIPVAVVGRVPRPLGRPELRQVAELLSDRMVAEARRGDVGT